MIFSALTVGDMLNRYGTQLRLKSHEYCLGWEKRISTSEVKRPGLALAGYIEDSDRLAIIVFGKIEFSYLLNLTEQERTQRLEKIITENTPVIIVAENVPPLRELDARCQKKGVALLQSMLKPKECVVQLSRALTEHFSPRMSCHGTLVEAFGIGVLIEGESSIGKSETALGLIKRGHRLIADDRVYLQKKESSQLVGRGSKLSRHLLEVRGIGIINVAHLYGAGAIRDEVAIEVVICLEKWKTNSSYDHIGLEEQYRELLGTQVPLYVLPVNRIRDKELLIEVAILNERLKSMGSHAAKEFNQKLLKEIAQQRREKDFAH